MYPYDIILLGTRVSIWNVALALGIIGGYPVLRAALRSRCGGGLPRFLPLRWIFTAYTAAIGAQLFAYLFDLNTTALPPAGTGWARYYLDPLAGPKTLYGAIVLLPFAMPAVTLAWRDLDYSAALDAWTPAMFTVLGVARIGCFLQGCCYGIRSSALGVSFPPHGSLHWEQVAAGVITAGSWTAPVVPTQLLEAVGLFALAGWTFAALRRGRRSIFVPAVAGYSLLRFLLEFARADPDRNALGPFATSQWIALTILAMALGWRWSHPRTPAVVG